MNVRASGYLSVCMYVYTYSNECRTDERIFMKFVIEALYLLPSVDRF